MADDRTDPVSEETLRPGLEMPLAQSLGYQIRATHRLFQRALQTEIEKSAVTLGMWYFLRVLWSEDGITQSELSQRVGTMEPTTLSAIRDMERDGLVRRAPHADDRRKINIHLTDKGRDLREKLLPAAHAVIGAASAGLTAREKTMLIALLKAMQANLQASLQASLQE